MAWLLLVIAGILEAAWAIGLKYTHGFTRPVPSVLTIAGIVASMYIAGGGRADAADRHRVWCVGGYRDFRNRHHGHGAAR